MNKVKKLVSVVLAGAMALAMSISVMAATAGITPAEQKILDEAEKRAKELDVYGTKTYEEYVSEATRYLSQNELSDEQVDALVKAVDEAADTALAEMKAKGVSSLKDLSSEDLLKVIEKAESQVIAAAEKVGIKIQKVGDKYLITTEQRGSEPASQTNPDNASPSSDIKTNVIIDDATHVVKQTGAELALDGVDAAASIDATGLNTTGTVVMAVMFVGAVVACGVVAKKKDLFSSAEA